MTDSTQSKAAVPTATTPPKVKRLPTMLLRKAHPLNIVESESEDESDHDTDEVKAQKKKDQETIDAFAVNTAKEAVTKRSKEAAAQEDESMQIMVAISKSLHQVSGGGAAVDAAAASSSSNSSSSSAPSVDTTTATIARLRQPFVLTDRERERFIHWVSKAIHTVKRSEYTANWRGHTERYFNITHNLQLWCLDALDHNTMDYILVYIRDQIWQETYARKCPQLYSHVNFTFQTTTKDTHQELPTEWAHVFGAITTMLSFPRGSGIMLRVSLDQTNDAVPFVLTYQQLEINGTTTAHHLSAPQSDPEAKMDKLMYLLLAMKTGGELDSEKQYEIECVQFVPYKLMFEFQRGKEKCINVASHALCAQDVFDAPVSSVHSSAASSSSFITPARSTRKRSDESSDSDDADDDADESKLVAPDAPKKVKPVVEGGLHQPVGKRRRVNFDNAVDEEKAAEAHDKAGVANHGEDDAMYGDGEEVGAIVTIEGDLIITEEKDNDDDGNEANATPPLTQLE
jgi:hypothetical protein